MTGSRESVLGVRWEQALEGFRTQMAVRFTTAEDDLWVNAVVVDIGPDGLARSIEQVLEPAPPRRVLSKWLTSPAYVSVGFVVP